MESRGIGLGKYYRRGLTLTEPMNIPQRGRRGAVVHQRSLAGWYQMPALSVEQRPGEIGTHSPASPLPTIYRVPLREDLHGDATVQVGLSSMGVSGWQNPGIYDGDGGAPLATSC